jgi:hypothetical protein
VIETEVRRNPEDHRRFDLAGIGYARVVRRLRGDWIFVAPAQGQWSLGKGAPRGVSTAVDETGTVVCSYTGKLHQFDYRGRTLHMHGAAINAQHRLDPLLLHEGDRELVRYAGQPWSGTDKHPMAVTIIDEQLSRDDPLLIVFAAFFADTVAAMALAGNFSNG